MDGNFCWANELLEPSGLHHTESLIKRLNFLAEKGIINPPQKSGGRWFIVGDRESILKTLSEWDSFKRSECPEEYYLIGDLVKITGLSESTIRHRLRKSKIPVGRTEDNKMCVRKDAPFIKGLIARANADRSRMLR